MISTINTNRLKGRIKELGLTQAQWGHDQKWKGTLRLYVPTNGDEPQAKRSQAVFKAFTDAAEASNPGYK